MKIKQTLSTIYRLGFLILCLWAFFDRAVGFFTAVKSPEVAVCCGLFLCFLAVFLCALHGDVPKILLRVKAVFTAMALFFLMLHFSVWFTPKALSWIFCVGLPLLAFVDWLLFDKKGAFRPLDILFWFLGLLVLLALCMLLTKTPFRLSSLLSLLGVKDKLVPLILAALFAGGLMYLLDSLLSGKKSGGIWDLFAFLYRLVFLALTAYALGEYAHRNVTEFWQKLSSFVPLFAFLSFLCIATVVLIGLVRFRSIHAQTPFPRVKGGFTALAVLFLAGSRFVLKGNVPAGDIVSVILYHVCPVMMLFDWILFDAKGKWKITDPLYWAAAPLVYGLLVFLFFDLYGFYPALSQFSVQNMLLYGIGGTLACCYGVYLVDFLFRRK